MYGLPQVGKVASDYLIPRLTTAGYRDSGHTPGLYKHQTNSIIVALVVDDFFVQHTSLDDFHHLADTLRQNYTTTTDMRRQNSVASHWIGTTKLDMSRYLCRDMWIKLSNGSAI
jgi:hypothetical protein